MQSTPKKIKLAGENNTVAVDWSDGHRSLYPYQYLREKCPCATCTDAHGTSMAKTVPSLSSMVLPMLQKALKPERAELVGRYAVQIYWSDGHSTGIYGFDYLRELCPCAECVRLSAREEGPVVQ
jgi:DUF971 family protein